MKKDGTLGSADRTRVERTPEQLALAFLSRIYTMLNTAEQGKAKQGPVVMPAFNARQALLQMIRSEGKVVRVTFKPDETEAAKE